MPTSASWDRSGIVAQVRHQGAVHSQVGHSDSPPQGVGLQPQRQRGVPARAAHGRCASSAPACAAAGAASSIGSGRRHGKHGTKGGVPTVSANRVGGHQAGAPPVVGRQREATLPPCPPPPQPGAARRDGGPHRGQRRDEVGQPSVQQGALGCPKCLHRLLAGRRHTQHRHNHRMAVLVPAGGGWQVAHTGHTLRM
jgi:hypothetical protein